MRHSWTVRPPLANLETVCLVARAGSFSAAAAMSGATHGAVSRRVSAIENWLGIRLFERHGRGVRLTPEGQRYVGRVEDAFHIIDGATDQWRTGGRAREVKLSVLPSFADLWLFERLSHLEAAPNPLRIQLDINSRCADVATGEVDLAIRYGYGGWPNVDAELFLNESLYPVAHRDIAAQFPRGDDASMLDFPLLHDSDMTGWRTWLNDIGITARPRGQDRRFDDYSLVLAAAEAGLGIALAREPLATSRLAERGLVRLSERTVQSPRGYYFVMPKRERKPETDALIEKIRVLIG